jgi:hypothetical protein
LFSEIGLIDIDNEIYFLQDKNYLDENLKIAFEKVGKGFLYFFPFTLSNVFSNHKYSRKKFYDKRKELPSEDVSNVSKYKFLKIISISLSALFHKIKLPFVTKWYYPNSKKSFFSFRIDTDFCSLEDAKKLYELTLKYKIPTTWFVDTSSKENLQNLYSKLPQNNEVGLHAFRHLIFRSYKENDKNINKGLEILKKYGIVQMALPHLLASGISLCKKLSKNISFIPRNFALIMITFLLILMLRVIFLRHCKYRFIP